MYTFIMQTKIKVKNGTITLPAAIRKRWRGAHVFVAGEKDTLIIKRITSPSFSEMLDEFQQVGKGISRAQVTTAIKSVRRIRSVKR